MPRQRKPHSAKQGQPDRRNWDEAHDHCRTLVSMAASHPGRFPGLIQTFNLLADHDSIRELGGVWVQAEGTEARDKPNILTPLLSATRTRTEIDRAGKQHREWGEWMTAVAAASPLPPIGAGRGGRIRLGFLSSDLRTHAVAKFLLPLFQCLDREKLEIFCYCALDAPNDPIQVRIRELSDEFRLIDGIPDRDAALLIRGDQIDVLFELNGHTPYSRIGLLAYQAAPVQIEYLGYAFTTGLDAIDYFLVDGIFAPEDSSWMTETPLKMPESWVCFGEFPDEPVTERRPLAKNGGEVIFGTLNSPHKFSENAFELWARVLHAVPASQFMTVRPECASETLVTNVRREFARRGIDGARLNFVDNTAEARSSHFAWYNEIDITLDTFPVTGGTTTCDALWMGCPVVSLYGPALHHRISYSILTNSGLGDLCTTSPDDFVDIAVALTKDPERLTDIRMNTRDRMRASSLCNAERFTREFETVMMEVVERHNLR